MHQNAERVQQALADSGSPARVVELESSARTASEAAATLGVELGQIVKSLVFAADGFALLVLVAGDRRADLEKMRGIIGATRVERADPDFVRKTTGFPIGGVSPLGHAEVIRTLVDESLERFATLWAAAGTPHTVFPTTFEELLTLTKGEPGDLT